MKGCPVSGSNLEYFINRTVEISKELPSLWASSDYYGKRKLQYRVFPEGICYNKKNDQPRTSKINPLFSVIAGLKRNTEEKETGTSEIIFKNSGLVVSPRIELGSRV